MLLALFSGGCAERDELTISAASSLREPLKIVAQSYEKSFPESGLIFNFGGTGSLSRQIINGAPVDVLLSAAEDEITVLINFGQILPDSHRILLTNRLMVVTPPDSEKISDFNQLALPEMRRIAIGEVYSAPVGQYAKEALENLGLWEKLKPKLIYAKDALQVLSYVETGQVDAGIIYKSDAIRTGLDSSALEIPAEIHSPIRYSGGIVATTQNKEKAARFLNYLSTDEAQVIFQSHGFGIVKN